VYPAAPHPGQQHADPRIQTLLDRERAPEALVEVELVGLLEADEERRQFAVAWGRAGRV
jgi:hypothetical protein